MKRGFQSWLHLFHMVDAYRPTRRAEKDGIVQIEEFNELDAGRAADAVRPCAAIESFVSAVVAGRPYADLAALLHAAEAQAAEWTTAEVDAALKDHPRIGERPARGSTSAALSRAEQAGVSGDAGVRQRLAEGNQRYEERFGRIYLVRAKGRSAEELLDLLDQRLGHDAVTEEAVVRQQLAEIALLRLAGLFEDVA